MSKYYRAALVASKKKGNVEKLLYLIIEAMRTKLVVVMEDSYVVFQGLLKL